MTELRQSETQSLVRQEKEGSILEDRAAEDPTKIIVSEGRLLKAFEIRKPIVGIERVVAKIIKQSAVKSICPRTR